MDDVKDTMALVAHKRAPQLVDEMQRLKREKHQCSYQTSPTTTVATLPLRQAVETLVNNFCEQYG